MSDINFMIEIEEIFKLAYNQSMANRSEAERSACILFLDDLIGTRKPFSLVSEEGIPVTTDYVFNNPVAADLVEDVKFHFFSRWGYQNQKLQNLCEHLAFGVAADMSTGEDIRSTPEDYNDRYPDYESTVKYLISNKWVISLLLLQLCIVIEEKELILARRVLGEENGAA